MAVKIVQFSDETYAVRKGLGIPLVSPFEYYNFKRTSSDDRCWSRKNSTKFDRCLTWDFWVAKKAYEKFNGPITGIPEGTGEVVDPRLTLANMKLGDQDSDGFIDDAVTTADVNEVLDDLVKMKSREMRKQRGRF